MPLKHSNCKKIILNELHFNSEYKIAAVKEERTIHKCFF